MFIVHWVVHFLGVDYGVEYGHWVWYNFWSDVAGSFIIGMLVWLGTYYIHHTCHDNTMCFRWGKYEAANGIFKLCWKHHPDMAVKPHRELIARLHKESKVHQCHMN